MNIVRLCLTMTVMLAAKTAATAAGASKPAADAAPLPVMASLVEDNRTTLGISGSSACRVSLNFLGDDAKDATLLLHPLVTHAVDELGRDLTPNDTMPARNVPLFGREPSGRNPAMLIVTLRNPSRRASVIKHLEGVVDLYNPTEANGGLVRLRSALAERGPIKSQQLEPFGIELKYLSDEEAARVRRGTFGTSAEDEPSRLQAVAAEVARRRAQRMLDSVEARSENGPDTSTTAASIPVIPASQATIATAASSADPSQADQPRRTMTRVAIECKDPQHLLVDLAIHDSHGKSIGFRNAAFNGTYSFLLSQPLPKDAELVAYVATPDSLEKRTFALDNIVLP